MARRGLARRGAAGQSVVWQGVELGPKGIKSIYYKGAYTMTKDYTKIIFNGGISTEPEVNDLIEKIGIPTPGQQISYKTIGEIAKATRGTGRWNSITLAWRKRLERQHNILLIAVPNEGFQAMNNSDRVNEAGKKFKTGLKRIERAVIVVQKTDRAGLSDDEKKAADFIQNTGASLRAAERLAARSLAYPELDKAVMGGTN